MSLGQRAVRGTAIVLASSYTNMAVGFVTTVLLTRLLAPDDFGLLAMATFFFSLLDLRGKLGLDFAFVHRQPTTDELVATHLALQCALSLGSLALVLAVSPFLVLAGYSPRLPWVLAVLAGIGLVEAVGTTPRLVLEKELAFARSTVIITGSLTAANVLAVFLAWRGAGLVSLLVQSGANVLFSTIGLWLMSRLRLRKAFRRELAGWMLRFGLAVAVGSIAAVVLLQYDYFLVGTFVSATALGYYERAYKIAVWPTGLVTHVVSRTAFPTYAKVQDDRGRLSQAFNMTLWLITMVALPIAMAMFVTAPDFVRVLFGERWLPSAQLLRLLVAVAMLRPLLDDTGALFNAVGQPRRISTVLAVQAVTLVLLGTPMTWRWGAMGTAVAVGIAFLAGIILDYWYVRQVVDLSPRQAFGVPALGLAAGLLLWWGSRHSLNTAGWPPFARLLCEGGISLTAFYGVVGMLQRDVVRERLYLVWALLWGRTERGL
ncbi:MAG: lipopolysaccharide biosynthesis protein [Anaerolineae bacterium]